MRFKSFLLLYLDIVVGLHHGVKSIKSNLIGVTMYKRSTIQAQTLGLCISRCAADMLCDRLDYQNNECTLGQKYPSPDFSTPLVDVTEMWEMVYSKEHAAGIKAKIALQKQVCLTTDGRRCIFPFTFNRKTYTFCSLDNAANLQENRPWCSTQTDQQGNHIGNIGAWGYCESPCPLG
ncbi:uncharacterized protein LOC111713351 [Eurytemora carolleeae]|uniref:uncharacterized protein LOC111713351 n=1 Tax=Eurytemora carolleeae TaxID=1294199 RepID=UPI000C790BF7|nr:uncharacterized protein LOC111713351 [Eurytemora carolleeae]|eukprot:XP_023343971.1 uncharacterized protein LOC111713351 [Eurytemora affinis]